MTSPSTRSGKAGGFTLIELMVVVTIIGILVGILLPVINSVIRNGQIQQAKADVSTLEIALRAYQTRYTRFPAATGEPGQPVRQALLDILSGSDAGSDNPAGVRFLEYKSSSVQNGEYVDPWGKPYQVSTDTNLDNQNASLSIPRPILVWSGGPDEDLSTLHDNIKHW